MPKRRRFKLGDISRRTPKAQFREITRDGGAVTGDIVKQVLTGVKRIDISSSAVRGGRLAQQQQAEAAARKELIRRLLQSVINQMEGRPGNPNEVMGGWKKVNGEWVRDPNPPRTKPAKKDVEFGRKVLEHFGLDTPAVMGSPPQNKGDQLDELVAEIAHAHQMQFRTDRIHTIDKNPVKRGKPSQRQQVLRAILDRVSKQGTVPMQKLIKIAEMHRYDLDGTIQLYRQWRAYRAAIHRKK